MNRHITKFEIRGNNFENKAKKQMLSVIIIGLVINFGLLGMLLLLTGFATGLARGIEVRTIILNTAFTF